MSAKQAFDAWGWDVEYFFQCRFGDCHDSGWRRSRTYVDSGLSVGMEYGYRVKARDELGNETEWSTTRFAGVQDKTPPTPAPYIDSIDPNSSQSITMTATLTNDENLVQYRFVPDPNFPGAHDSGWQDSNVYIDVNLLPQTTYCYRVKARDLSGNLNETPLSPRACTTTLTPPDLNPPLPDRMQFDPNGLPREYYDPNTGDFWVEMQAATAVDDSGGPVQYQFYCEEYSGIYPDGFSSDWLNTSIWQVQVGRQNQYLRFRVRARDQYGNATRWSDWERAIARADQPALADQADDGTAGGGTGGGGTGGGGAVGGG